MFERLGSVAYDRDPQLYLTDPDLPRPQREEDYADETAAAIDGDVRSIVQAATDRALRVLRERLDVLERSA